MPLESFIFKQIFFATQHRVFPTSTAKTEVIAMLESIIENSPDYLPPSDTIQLSEDEVLKKLRILKQELSHEMIVLGHHYQSDAILEFADYTGDSYALSLKAQSINKPYVVFCGVHFMAETADMLTNKDQAVLLPDLNAGCSMADMANQAQVENAWETIAKSHSKKVLPITYINCTASLKAFVGKHGGSICTSSNAKKVIKWALNNSEQLLFFPDQHLGRNTCYELGIDLKDMVIYNPALRNGGLTEDQIQKAKIILWYGYCSVHQGFQFQHIQKIKKEKPNTTIIVHPECSFDVVQSAHLNGSTSFIVDVISSAPDGSSFAVGTEINLVNRLSKMFPPKEVFSLSPYQCLCTTMYRVRPKWLLKSFLSIKQKTNLIHHIKVDEQTTELSKKALKRMIDITEGVLE